MWIINQKTCVWKKVEGFLVVDSGVLIRQHEHKRESSGHLKEVGQCSFSQTDSLIAIWHAISFEKNVNIVCYIRQMGKQIDCMSSIFVVFTQHLIARWIILGCTILFSLGFIRSYKSCAYLCCKVSQFHCCLVKILRKCIFFNTTKKDPKELPTKNPNSHLCAWSLKVLTVHPFDRRSMAMS